MTPAITGSQDSPSRGRRSVAEAHQPIGLVRVVDLVLVVPKGDHRNPSPLGSALLATNVRVPTRVRRQRSSPEGPLVMEDIMKTIERLGNSAKRNSHRRGIVAKKRNP